MKLANRYKPVFFVLALLFALLSITESGAISHGSLEREALATISGDDKAVLRLEGFYNGIYDIRNEYERFGAITNNNNQYMVLVVTIQPYFLEMKNKHSSLSIKIKSTIREFHAGSSSKQIELLLLPGETVDVQASLFPGENTSVLSSFSFSAKNLSGTFSMELIDTLWNPRRILCY